MTQVSEVMTRDVRTLSPRDPIVRAAQAMEELDIGVVPVCEGDRLVGMVTDRDIVVRGLARGLAAEQTPLEEVMSRDPRWCFADQTVDEVLEQMRDAQIRRLPVLDRGQHLVGMLSLGDVALKADADGAGIVLGEISEPSTGDAGEPENATARASSAAAAEGVGSDGTGSGNLPAADPDAGLGADTGAGSGTSADSGPAPVIGDGTGGHLGVGSDPEMDDKGGTRV